MKKLILIILLSFKASFAFFVFEAAGSNFQSGKDYYYLSISATGVKKDEVKAFTQSGRMFIEIKSPKLEYSQIFTLPQNADETGIEGSLNDDILTFKIKKISDKKITKNEIKIK